MVAEEKPMLWNPNVKVANPRFRRRVLSIFFSVLALGVLQASCGGSGDSLSQTPFAPIMRRPIEQTDFAFDVGFNSATSPTDAVGFHVHNVGSVDHTFTIDDLDVDILVHPGDTETVVVANRTGVYALYCRFHRAQGMEAEFQLIHQPLGTRPN